MNRTFGNLNRAFENGRSSSTVGKVFGALLTLLVCLWGSPALATTVRVVNLRDLVDGAERIFLGRCVAVEEGRLGHLAVTSYTFEVVEAVAGVESPTVKLRQVGAPGSASAGGSSLATSSGLPSYVPGEEVLLFLGAESSLGLSAPVGLGQGVFRVHGRGAARSVVNDFGNKNLAWNLPASWLPAAGPSGERVPSLDQLAQGRLDARAFITLVRERDQARRPPTR